MVAGISVGKYSSYLVSVTVIGSLGHSDNFQMNVIFHDSKFGGDTKKFTGMQEFHVQQNIAAEGGGDGVN